MIEKRGKYWPKKVSSDDIDDHLKDMEIGKTDTLIQKIGGVNFLVHCQQQ